jgi:hypothetical protein
VSGPAEATAFAAYPEKLQAYGASGDLPDIMEVSYAWFPEWVKLGWLENLDAVVRRDRINAADFDKTVIGMGKWPYEKGPTYSWWTMMGIATFYYNRSPQPVRARTPGQPRTRAARRSAKVSPTTTERARSSPSSAAARSYRSVRGFRQGHVSRGPWGQTHGPRRSAPSSRSPARRPRNRARKSARE